MERLGALLEELDDRGVEADRDRARDLEDEARPAGRPAPSLTRSVAVPRAIHPQVGPDLEAVVEPDQQVLAERLDRGDLAADDPRHLRDGARPARPGRGDGPPDEVRPQPGGRPEEGVALGHSGPGPWRSEDETAIAGNEAGLEQERPERRRADLLAVDLADDQLTDATVGDERAQGTRRAVTATAGSSAAGSVWIVDPPRSR